MNKSNQVCMDQHLKTEITQSPLYTTTTTNEEYTILWHEDCPNIKITLDLLILLYQPGV
jgi:hypothetical protein